MTEEEIIKLLSDRVNNLLFLLTFQSIGLLSMCFFIVFKKRLMPKHTKDPVIKTDICEYHLEQEIWYLNNNYKVESSIISQITIDQNKTGTYVRLELKVNGCIHYYNGRLETIRQQVFLKQDDCFRFHINRLIDDFDESVDKMFKYNN